MRKLIVGSQARQAGAVTEYGLRRGYTRMHRDIYVPKGYSPDLSDVIDGAWLRSGRKGVVAGIAASALHGAAWVDAGIPVELIWNNTRPPEGIVARAERLEPDEITALDGIAVTTAARTAYDLGRHFPRQEALIRLDALKRATAYLDDEVLVLTRRYKGARAAAARPAALGRWWRGFAARDTAAVAVSRRGVSPTKDPGRGVRRTVEGHPQAGYGLGRLHGCFGVRRRSAPHRPGAVRQGPAADAEGRAAGLGRHPGDQGGSRRRRTRPHVCGAGSPRVGRPAARWPAKPQVAATERARGCGEPEGIDRCTRVCAR